MKTISSKASRIPIFTAYLFCYFALPATTFHCFTSYVNGSRCCLLVTTYTLALWTPTCISNHSHSAGHIRLHYSSRWRLQAGPPPQPVAMFLVASIHHQEGAEATATGDVVADAAVEDAVAETPMLAAAAATPHCEVVAEAAAAPGLQIQQHQLQRRPRLPLPAIGAPS